MNDADRDNGTRLLAEAVLDEIELVRVEIARKRAAKEAKQATPSEPRLISGRPDTPPRLATHPAPPQTPCEDKACTMPQPQELPTSYRTMVALAAADQLGGQVDELVGGPPASACQQQGV